MFRSQTFLARLAYVTLFVAVGASAPFLPVYYRSLGIGLGTISLLGALMAGAGLIGSPLWGAIADRFRTSNLVLPAAALLAGLGASALSLASWPFLLVLVLVMGIGTSGIGPVLDTRALETVGEDRDRYSRFRVWGSASFVVSAIAVGWVIERTGPQGLFFIYVPMIVATAVIGLGLRPHGLVPPMPRLEGVVAVVRSPILGRFLLAILIAWSSSSAVNAFFSIYLGDIGAPDTLIGFAWAIGAVVEVPLMIAFPLLARRFGTERLIVLGAASLVVRAICVALLRDPLLVTATMLLHGCGFAMLTVGGVTYVAGHAPRGAAATAQGVLTATSYSLAMVVGPAISGVLASALPLPSVFAVAGIGSGIAVAALLWALAPGLRSVSGSVTADADPGPGTVSGP